MKNLRVLCMGHRHSSPTREIRFIMADKILRGEVKVTEVRHGLFRIMWDLISKMDNGVKYEQKFELCGTQSGRSFHITSRKSLGGHSIYIILKHVSRSQSDGNQDQPNAKRQKIEEEESHSKEFETMSLVKLCLPGKSDPAIKHNPDKWTFYSPETLKGDEPYLEFFIDFGSNEKNEKSIITGLSGMFHDQTMCDIKFKFKNSEEIGAHVAILSAGCPVFAVMFQSDFVESKTRTVNIADFEMEVFKEMLIFLYTGKPPKVIDFNFTKSIYEVADKYCIEHLKDDCVNILKTQLNINNAMELLVWAEFQSIRGLFDSAMVFILKNSDELFSQPNWLDFMKNHPELCLQIKKKMAKLLVVCFENGYFTDDDEIMEVI